MVIVRLRGGLGNQLFQYAAGFALAEHHHTGLKFDLYYYRKHRNRLVELKNFPVNIEEASREEVHSFTGSNPVIRFINKRENYLHCPQVFPQPHFHFVENFFDLPSHVYISGYWTSEKYFVHLRAELVKRFSSIANETNEDKEWIRRIRDSNSVAVHVRRGDYVNGPYKLFASLPMDYYNRAVEWMRSKITSPSFFVFSDDIPWCQKNLIIGDCQFVDTNRGLNSYKDLILMQYCKHNIIANSTFSWWGAWLNNNREKEIAAPSKWFANSYVESAEVVYPYRFYNTKDLIPASWKIL